MSSPIESPADLTSAQRNYLRALRVALSTPHTVAGLVAKSWLGYLLILVVNGLALALLINVEQIGGAIFIIGFTMGVFIRDLSWFRRSVMVWPAIIAITDRAKLDELIGESHQVPSGNERENY